MGLGSGWSYLHPRSLSALYWTPTCCKLSRLARVLGLIQSKVWLRTRSQGKGVSALSLGFGEAQCDESLLYLQVSPELCLPAGT